MRRGTRWSAWIPALALVGLFAAMSSDAAQLTLGTPRMGGNGWEAPVLLQPGAGESVVSLQFDVVLPNGFDSPAAAFAGDALNLAGKQLIFSQIGPGQMRVVIAGLNQAAISGGQIATLQLGNGGNAPGALLNAPVLSSPDGSRVPVVANTETPEGEPAPVDEEDPETESPEGEEPPKQNPDPAEPEPDNAPEAPEDSGGDNDSGRFLNGSPFMNGGGGGMVSDARGGKKGSKAKSASTSRRRDSGSGTVASKNNTATLLYMARNEPRGAADRRAAEAMAQQNRSHPDQRGILNRTSRPPHSSTTEVSETSAATTATEEPFDLAKGGRGGGGARGGGGRVGSLAGAGAMGGAGRGGATISGNPPTLVTKVGMLLFGGMAIALAAWVYSIGGKQYGRRSRAKE